MLERTIIHNMSGNSSNFILLIFDSLLHNLKVGGLVWEIEVHPRVAEYLREEEIFVGLIF